MNYFKSEVSSYNESFVQAVIYVNVRKRWGLRLFRKLNNFSQQINKVFRKKQNLKLEILKCSVKVKEFEIGG
jgi:hypothetical protein